MAQTREPFDWSNNNRLKERTINAVKEFFGKEEPDHPLSPEMIAKINMEFEQDESLTHGEEDPNADRIHRSTERRRISDNPNSVWPG